MAVIVGAPGACESSVYGNAARAARDVAGGIRRGRAQVGRLVRGDRRGDPGRPVERRGRALSRAASRCSPRWSRSAPSSRPRRRAPHLGLVVARRRGGRRGRDGWRVGTLRVLGVGEQGRAARHVPGRVGGRGAQVGRLVRGHGGRDPRRAVEGGGGAGADRRAAAVGGRVDPHGRAGLGAGASHLGLVVARRRGRGSRRDRRRARCQRVLGVGDRVGAAGRAVRVRRPGAQRRHGVVAHGDRDPGSGEVGEASGGRRTGAVVARVDVDGGRARAAAAHRAAHLRVVLVRGRGRAGAGDRRRVARRHRGCS